MNIPPPFDKFEKLVGPNGKLVVVHAIEQVGEKEITETYLEYCYLGLRRSDFAHAAKELFPSEWAVSIGYCGEEGMALIDAWRCYREEPSESLPYDRL